MVTTAPKRLLAKPDHVLIDDKDSNVEEFIKDGGRAYMPPQPWNSRHKEYGTDWLPELEKFLGI
jgi:hypothetical protein